MYNIPLFRPIFDITKIFKNHSLVFKFKYFDLSSILSSDVAQKRRGYADQNQLQDRKVNRNDYCIPKSGGKLFKQIFIIGIQWMSIFHSTFL